MNPEWPFCPDDEKFEGDAPQSHWWAAILTILLAIGLFIVASIAFGHEAPSGWKYPGICCAQEHCHPIPCEAAVETKTGIAYDGMTFVGPQIRASGDAECHACFARWRDGTRAPYCIFLRPGA